MSETKLTTEELIKKLSDPDLVYLPDDNELLSLGKQAAAHLRELEEQNTQFISLIAQCDIEHVGQHTGDMYIKCRMGHAVIIAPDRLAGIIKDCAAIDAARTKEAK